MAPRDQPRHGSTIVLRHQAARIVQGRPESGYTEACQLICCNCRDHPDLDYSEVSPGLQRVRGTYSIARSVSAIARIACAGMRLLVLSWPPDRRTAEPNGARPGRWL